MIETGGKIEEYREIKEYWMKRLLVNVQADDLQRQGFIDRNGQLYGFRQYDEIHFRNGYSRDARKMTFKFNGTSVGQPVFKWFGRHEEGNIFIIHLGHRIS